MNKIINKKKETIATFEDIKHIDENGYEYWNARELQVALEYTQWRNFELVIKKAKKACENSEYNVSECFADLSKILEMPKGGVKRILDYKLNRYACYLIVQNGDPRKKVIALGETAEKVYKDYCKLNTVVFF